MRRNVPGPLAALAPLEPMGLARAAQRPSKFPRLLKREEPPSPLRPYPNSCPVHHIHTYEQEYTGYEVCLVRRRKLARNSVDMAPRTLDKGHVPTYI